MKHRLGVLAVAASLVALTPGPAFAHGDDDARPGAPGAGDPYYPLDGNGGYNVRHYDLDLKYNPADDRLRGVATISARATQDLSRFNLDFVGLRVHKVWVDHERARWSRDGQELTIRPRTALHDEDRFTVKIAYSGVPETLGDPQLGITGFIHTDDGAIAAGQPDAAATWFPANDHPKDAASVSVDIAVPEGLEAISNGVLAGTHTRHGWTTWKWRAEEPMATYLTVLAIGQFDLREYEEDGIRFWDALDPDLFSLDIDPQNPENPPAGEVAEAAFARHTEIIDFLEDFSGQPYPFEASGGIVDDFEELGFALETQTRPIYASGFFFDETFATEIVVHELAHMWFGDDLRVKTWRHIWLNEGFATYTQWLWLEREGLVTAQEIFDFLSGIPAADDVFWGLETANPGPDDLFDFEAVYLRGAMTLHALRLEVGDDAFFRIVHEWAESQSGGTVATSEFITVAERVAGRQLDDFFETWLFTPAKPAGLPDAPPPPGAAESTSARSSAADQVLARITGSPLRR
jgi:aminopeptidase N